MSRFIIRTDGIRLIILCAHAEIGCRKVLFLDILGCVCVAREKDIYKEEFPRANMRFFALTMDSVYILVVMVIHCVRASTRNNRR